MQTVADRIYPDIGQQLLAITSAADHAAGAHKGQFRKDRRTPYIIHPARVAALVGMFGGTHVAIILRGCMIFMRIVLLNGLHRQNFLSHTFLFPMMKEMISTPWWMR